MTRAPYNISKAERTLLRAWPTSADRPAIFLTVPPVRDVGEEELIRELCSLSYEASGFADSPERHRLSRIYPYEGLAADYARFVDEPLLTAEIGNEFRGVDCIDLTGWLGKDLESPNWERLLEYIGSDSECDYVFIAYTDRHQLVDGLARSIVSRGGIPVLRVNAMPPSLETLATLFHEETGMLFDGELDVVWDWLQRLVLSQRVPNYAYVKTVASMARYACGTWADRRSGLAALLDQQAQLAPSAEKTRRIGF